MMIRPVDMITQTCIMPLLPRPCRNPCAEKTNMIFQLRARNQKADRTSPRYDSTGTTTFIGHEIAFPPPPPFSPTPYLFSTNFSIASLTPARSTRPRSASLAISTFTTCSPDSCF